MALTDEVTERYSAARLIQLTNPGVPAASAVNATNYADAAADVEADFQIYCGVEYDGTDTRHVSVAVEGVVAYLYTRGEASGSDANARLDRFRERLQSLALVTGRNRILPKTQSVLTSTSEQVGSETVAPAFDNDDFDQLVPKSPKT